MIVTQVSYTEQARIILQNTGYAVSIVDQPRRFLDRVWAQIPAIATSIVGICYDDTYFDKKLKQEKGTTDTLWCFGDEKHNYDFMAWLQAHNNDPRLIAKGNGNIYWLSAGRRPKVMARAYHARGTLDELTAIGSLAVDIDCAEQNMTLQQAFDALLRLVLKPHIIVFTGGGLQAIHLLSEPWLLYDKELSATYRAQALALYKPLFEQYGVTPDWQVFEAARMWRLPGTVNRKLKRGGAMACILAEYDHAPYSIAEIAAAAPPAPVKQKQVVFIPPSVDGSYLVDDLFLTHMVHGMPLDETTAKHGLLRQLAQRAAAAGIPAETLTPLLRAKALLWFSDTSRAYGELDSLIVWGYAHPNSGAQRWAITAASGGFERGFTGDLEVQDGATKLKVLDKPPERILTFALTALQTEQNAIIDSYLQRVRSRSQGDVLLLRTSPGAGKTFAVLQAVIKAVQDDPTLQVLFLTQYRMDTAQGIAWLAEHGITDPAILEKFGFFEARTPDENSPGYCAQSEKANLLGAKNHNVLKSLCHAGCPAYFACEQRGYLAQFNALAHVPIVVARHHHGWITKLTENRKLIVIDESMLSIISEPVEITLEQLMLVTVDPVLEDQRPDDVLLVGKLLDTLRSVIAGNNIAAAHKFTGMNEVKLWGYWLLDALVKAVGKAAFEVFLALDKSFINSINKTSLGSDDLKSIAELPPNYLLNLQAILKYEYERYYRVGATAWNSRLVPYEHSLRIHVMKPLALPRNVHLIVLDAEGDIDLYPVALTDMQGKPRLMILFERTLDKRGTVTQFTGTENAKSTLLAKPKEVGKLDVAPKKAITVEDIILHPGAKYELSDTYDLSIAVRDAGNAALAKTVVLIHQLAIRHAGDLLLISYKRLMGDDELPGGETFLRKWIANAGILAPENVQHFNNVRGKNNWKNVTAVLVLGTPRLQLMDLLILGQVWHWQDDQPLEIERADIDLPYQYTASDGTGMAYIFHSFKDERLHRLYYHVITSEIIQCYYRIRPDSSDTERHVYIGTSIPCSPYVDYLISWDSAGLQTLANIALQRIYDTDIGLSMREISEAVAKEGRCTEDTARKWVKLELTEGRSFMATAQWAKKDLSWETLLLLRPDVNNQTRVGGKPDDKLGETKVDKLARYLQQHPEAALGGLAAVQATLQAAFPDDTVSKSTAARALARSLVGVVKS